MQKITLQNLRSILRREESNLEKKVTLVLMIVNMYRLLEPKFYEMCVGAIVHEYCAFDSLPKKEYTYNVLMSLLTEVDWQRKRFSPNAKEVIEKIKVAAF